MRPTDTLYKLGLMMLLTGWLVLPVLRALP